MIRLRSTEEQQDIPDEIVRERLNGMRELGALTDMAICSGHKMFHCHQIVVGKASLFMNLLIKKSREEMGGTIIICVGEKHAPNVDNLLRFIYQGNVLIKPQDLNGLIKLANNLGIKLLVEGVEPVGIPQPSDDQLDKTNQVKASKISKVVRKKRSQVPAKAAKADQQKKKPIKKKMQAKRVSKSGNNGTLLYSILQANRLKKKAIKKLTYSSLLPNSSRLISLLQESGLANVGNVGVSGRPRRKAYEAAEINIKKCAAQLLKRSFNN